MPLGDRLRLVRADITTLDVDGIVNAANAALAVGGGVCGAIHRAAGPELAEACREAGVCRTGEVRVTPGFELAAPWVFHAVGPVWRGGGHDEDRLLAACYRNAIAAAERQGVRSLAFPAISTGIYAFPLERATVVALRAIADALAAAPGVREVLCACFDDATLAVYRRVRDELQL
jgi:O-acetyl-ADP-ribose deacetylase (regulator of RNase III)